MASLSALSNFLGAKDHWKTIITRYGLRWNGKPANFDNLTQLISTDRFSDMVNELKTGLEAVPERYSNYVKFDCLTGLRPNEAVQAVNLLRNNGHEYLNSELQVLEHFRFPQLFIRGKKRAYISIMDTELLETAHNTESADYETIRLEFKRRGLAFNMAFARKVFGTFIRRFTDPEILDLLQGRTPTSVFSRHYYTANFRTELEKIRQALPQLRQLLS